MSALAHAAPKMIPVELSREPDFIVGELQVRPARREVEAAGVSQVLERRVMQVLVALAQPTWDVVSREELNARCWSGLSVSADAVERCIARLRRLAERWPEPPFAIETIGKVGYYLRA